MDVDDDRHATVIYTGGSASKVRNRWVNAGGTPARAGSGVSSREVIRGVLTELGRTHRDGQLAACDVSDWSVYGQVVRESTYSSAVSSAGPVLCWYTTRSVLEGGGRLDFSIKRRSGRAWRTGWISGLKSAAAVVKVVEVEFRLIARAHRGIRWRYVIHIPDLEFVIVASTSAEHRGWVVSEAFTHRR
jgi:hypothetical protein